MKAAAEAHDADTLNEHVDYAKLRESFKGQLAAMMAEKLGSTSRSGSDAEKAGAALGSMLGMAMVDRLVDTMVRPEMVMKALQGAEVSPKPSAGPSAAADAGGQPKKPDVKWSYDRKSTDKLIAYAEDSSKPDDKKVGFVFERSGFADWKLTEIRLPSES